MFSEGTAPTWLLVPLNSGVFVVKGGTVREVVQSAIEGVEPLDRTGESEKFRVVPESLREHAGLAASDTRPVGRSGLPDGGRWARTKPIVFPIGGQPSEEPPGAGSCETALVDVARRKTRPVNAEAHVAPLDAARVD